MRFYCPDFTCGALDENESHHALHVLRFKEGEQIFIFDGKGKVAEAKLLKKGRQVVFEILSMKEAPAPACKLCLVQALPKGKAMELILQKATELGMQEIWPIMAERSVTQIREEKSEKKQEKWQQIVIEACKQCGQNWMPRVFPALSLKDFLEKNHEGCKLIASLHPQAQPLHALLKTEKQNKKIFFLVGPEGDFTSEETKMALACGFQPVSLGANVLRCETAAIFLTSVLNYEMLHR